MPFLGSRGVYCLEMILSHLTCSFNMSTVCATWTHFRPNSIIKLNISEEKELISAYSLFSEKNMHITFGIPFVPKLFASKECGELYGWNLLGQSFIVLFHLTRHFSSPLGSWSVVLGPRFTEPPIYHSKNWCLSSGRPIHHHINSGLSSGWPIYHCEGWCLSSRRPT